MHDSVILKMFSVLKLQWGRKGEGVKQRNTNRRLMGMDKGERDCLWELGGGVWVSNGGKSGTTVTEQKLKMSLHKKGY